MILFVPTSNKEINQHTESLWRPERWKSVSFLFSVCACFHYQSKSFGRALVKNKTSPFSSCIYETCILLIVWILTIAQCRVWYVPWSICDILLSPFISLFFDDFNIFLTVADSYNARIDSYNCRRQL